MSNYTGIDVSKLTIDCSISHSDGSVVDLKTGNNPDGFKKLLKHLSPDSHVVMEASGPYYYRLAYFLFESGILVSVVNPLVIRRFCQMRMVRTKTDKKDSSMIRQYGQTEHPELWQPDAPEITRLKQLNAAIELLDKNITASYNQLEAFKIMPDTSKSIVKSLEAVIKQNEKAKDKLEEEMLSLAKKKYNKSFSGLQSIPGIGPKSAALLVAVTGNFTKFNHYKELVAYVGLNPRIYESGTSVKGRGHISKMGTGKLRKLLYLCSWSAKRCNIHCKEMYERLKAKSKPEKVIKIAIANKLLRQAFAIGKYGRTFEVNYQNQFAF